MLDIFVLSCKPTCLPIFPVPLTRDVQPSLSSLIQSQVTDEGNKTPN